MSDAKELIFSTFAQKVLSTRLFHTIADPYVESLTGTVPIWALLDQLTSAMRKLSAAVPFQAHAQLGEFFTIK